MAIRHKVTKSTLDRGYASEWNDDHEENYYVRYSHQVDVLMPAIADHWDTVQDTSGTATTISLIGGHLAVRMRASGGAGNISTIRHSLLGAAANITDENAQPIVEICLDVQTPTADASTHEFGLFANATLPFTANQDGCYFRISNNVLYAVSGTGAAETTTNLGAPNQYGVYKVKHTATHDYFYVDDMETAVATHTTNICTNDLTVKISCAERAAGENFLNWQAVYISFLRQTS